MSNEQAITDIRARQKQAATYWQNQVRKLRPQGLTMAAKIAATVDVPWLLDALANATDELHVLFAVAPDVPFDAAATLKLSAPMLPRIRAMGYPAALCAQDGLENLDIPWDAFDVLFIAGSTEWKLSRPARDIAFEAKMRGKWVHMGRVNSWRRLQYAAAIGCDSCDGTYLTFGPVVNLRRLTGWLRAIGDQLPWGVIAADREREAVKGG